MAYTVKKLSDISGVTIRTLHFYEEAGLQLDPFHPKLFEFISVAMRIFADNNLS